MRLRREYLEKARTVNDSETLVIDVSILDALSAITIIYNMTNGATSNQGVHLFDDVDAINLVDGSEEIFSLNGLETVMLNCFELGHFPYSHLSESAAAVQYQAFTIHFGRYIGDQEFWLDPTDFRNLQLRLAHSLTISATAGFATGTGQVDVIAHAFDSKPSSRRGYLMTKEQYSFTSVASGVEKADLPTDFPWRMLIQRDYEAAIAPYTDLTNIKLNFDGGKYVPVDLAVQDIMQLNADKFGQFKENMIVTRTDADTIDTHIQDVFSCFANAINDLDVASLDAQTANRLTLQLLSLTAVPAIGKSAADTDVFLQVIGNAPFSGVVVPLGDMWDADTWLDVTMYDKAKLELTQGAAGGACQTVLQQVRS